MNIDSATVITSQANSANGANDWGNHNTPYVITPTGVEWYAYQGGPADQSDGNKMQTTLPWVLMRKTLAGPWALFATGPATHREKPKLYCDPLHPGDIILVAWQSSFTNLGINGQPYEYRSFDKSMHDIPGLWYGYPDGWPNANVDATGHPYASGTYMPDGRIVITRLGFPPGANPSTPNVPGYMQWAIRDTLGNWSAVRQTQFPYRVAYNHIDPTPDGKGMVMAGTRDCRWDELGLINPGGFGYAFDLLYVASWADINIAQPTAQRALRQITQTTTDGNIWYTGCETAMSAEGEWHIIGAGHGPVYNQKWFGDHFILDPYTLNELARVNSVEAPATFPVPFQNVSRIQQTSDGTWVMWSFWQDKLYVARSRDRRGLDMATPEVLTIPGNWAANSGNQWKPARNGSPLLLVNTLSAILMEQQAQTPVALKVSLSGVAPLPTPDPVPTPTPTPTPASNVAVWKREGNYLVAYIGDRVAHKLTLTVAERARLDKP